MLKTCTFKATEMVCNKSGKLLDTEWTDEANRGKEELIEQANKYNTKQACIHVTVSNIC
jgi:hypothetical protein